MMNLITNILLLDIVFFDFFFLVRRPDYDMEYSSSSSA